MSPGAAAEAIEIEVRLRADGGATMAREVRLGLTAKPKELAPKYFYDERGSQLFERITELPEYYPTRAEREILQRRSGEIVAAAGEPARKQKPSNPASVSRNCTLNITPPEFLRWERVFGSIVFAVVTILPSGFRTPRHH